MSAGSEGDALRRIATHLGHPPVGQTWMGDDCAVVDWAGADGGLLLAADVVVAGVHADLSLTTVADLGWKALAVNLSDIAAMGGRPGFALVTVVVPPGADLDALYEGLAACSSAFDCPIVGGDLSAGPVLSVSVAVTGRVVDRAVLRSGARPGDHVFVSGTGLGRSAAGLAALRAGRSGVDECVAAHARPTPRLAEGSLARTFGATAMMDLSDGVAADAPKLAAAAGVGLDLWDLPVAVGVDPASLAFDGGEDFELLCTAPGLDLVRHGFTCIGLVTDQPGVLTLDGAAWPGGGFEHRF